MVTLVHITPEANTARIRRSGLKAASTGRPIGASSQPSQGVYAFAQLPSFAHTYQWVREIARLHPRRPLVAVSLRIPDDEPVGLGHYGRGHRVRTAAEAVAELRALEDPRGWEVFVPRPVTAAEIRTVRAAPRVAGWRYFPGAHGTTPCTCDGCLTGGGYGEARLRRSRPHELDGPFAPRRVLLERLAAATATGDHAAAAEALAQLGSARGRQRWRGPVAELRPYAAHVDAEVRRQLVYAVCRWKSPGTEDLLRLLAEDQDPEVREAARWALEER